VPVGSADAAHAARTRWPTLIAASHFVALTIWVESLRRLPDIPGDARFPFFFGFAATCITTAAAFTGAGYFLVSALPTPLAVGLLFLTPVYFLSTIVRSHASPPIALHWRLGWRWRRSAKA
jgi:hypothetical protein